MISFFKFPFYLGPILIAVYIKIFESLICYIAMLCPNKNYIHFIKSSLYTVSSVATNRLVSVLTQALYNTKTPATWCPNLTQVRLPVYCWRNDNRWANGSRHRGMHAMIMTGGLRQGAKCVSPRTYNIFWHHSEQMSLCLQWVDVNINE